MGIIGELVDAHKELSERVGKRLRDEVVRAKARFTAAQTAERLYSRAAEHVWGIRHGTQEPTIMQAAYLERWMFVRSYTADKSAQQNSPRIETLECFVVPDLLEPQIRDGLPPGQTSDTVQPVNFTGRQVAEDMIGSLTGVSEGGEKDLILRPCPDCGEPSPLICHYMHDGEEDYIRVALILLCHRCPTATTLAKRANYRTTWDALFLQPKNV